MTREIEIKLELLRKLNDARELGYLMPEKVLLQHLQLLVKPPPEPAEVTTGLKALADQRLIIGVENALGGPLRWKISDLGKSELKDLLHS